MSAEDWIGGEDPDEYWEEDFDKLEKALKELANKVVNLAVKIDKVSKKLDDHVETADAHNPGILRKK